MIRTGQVGESEQHPIAAVQQHIRSGRLGLHAPYREWRAGTWMTHWRDYFSKRAGALRRVTSARVVSGEGSLWAPADYRQRRPGRLTINVGDVDGAMGAAASREQVVEALAGRAAISGRAARLARET